MFKRCQRARSGRCLPLLICDYDELHETMLEFLLTIKNPRARTPSFPLTHAPFLSLSLSLCISFSLCLPLRSPPGMHEDKTSSSCSSRSSVQDQRMLWLAGVQHAHCKRLSHATRIPNTHAPTTKESSSEALQQSTCLASLHNGNKATAARTAHHQRSQAGEALAVLI